jgi:membrane associated rhomboid family serine protease
MFLPFHDDNRIERTPVVTYALVALNVLCFLWLLQLPAPRRFDVTLHRGFIPARITSLATDRPVIVNEPVGPVLRDIRGCLWQPQQAVQLPADRGEICLSLLTCMFFHGSWVHLLGNMWFLWLFGNNVEDRLGHVAFLIFYLAGGLVGSGCHWLLNANSTAPVIGASGAIAAVLGAYAITWPWARIHTLVFLIIFITVVDLPALAVLGAWFLLQLVGGQEQLGLQTSGGVAWWAHVGGFLAGMAIMPLASGLLGVGGSEHRRPGFTPSEDERDHIIDVQILDDNPPRSSRP